MRTEDKEIDGPELERHERLTQSELEQEDEEALSEIILDEQRELARRESGALLSAVQAILARDNVVVEMLPLREHELRALEGLKAAVDGRDAKLHQFVYASDRRDLLEQALAVLQPNLAYDDAMYASLVQQVGELRHTLTVLEDSQDDLLVVREAAKVAKTGDADDAPEDSTGEVDDEAPRPSTLVGPELREAAKPPSSLSGPEAKEPPRPPSSLSGPEAKEPPKPPSSLGDPEDLAAAQAELERPPRGDAPDDDAPGGDAPKKKPWWKRPFG